MDKHIYFDNVVIVQVETMQHKYKGKEDAR